MNYSYMQVCRIDGLSLQEIEDVIECYTVSAVSFRKKRRGRKVSALWIASRVSGRGGAE